MENLIKQKKGIYFAIVAAILSGFAVFFASLAGKAVTDAYILTTSRNIIAAILFSSILLGISEWVNLKQITLKQWGQLILVGLIGGSIPFLLFFQGLSLSTASGGAFIQKTLFIGVSLSAIIFLKEKLGYWQWFALAILLVGNYFLGGLKSWQFGYGELLVFIATLFWAIEVIIVKKIIKKLPAIIIAWGRMFFGSVIMLGFLAFTNRLNVYNTLNFNQWLWIILPSILLFAYVWCWLSSLKYASASIVASILVIAAPITAFLSSIFVTHKYQSNQIIGTILIIAAIIICIKFLLRTKDVSKRKLTFR